MVLTDMEVLNPLFTSGEVRFYTIPQRIKGRRIELAIYAAPFNRVLARGLSDDKSIRRGSARPMARLDAKRACICQTTLFPV
jgi:hypothetical protein